MTEKFAPPTYDKAVGRTFNTDTHVAPGVPFVDRKPLTPERLKQIADAAKPKPVAKRVLVPSSIIERLTIATKDVFLELADAGVPHNAALAIAARLADLTASVVRLDAEVKELKANKGKTVKG